MHREAFVSNPILDKLPKHLLQYVIPQHYDHYSAVNQATWRYVMRKNVNYLRHVAHSSYLEGLDKTGISTERIPSMYGMNRILKEIGWAAVAVDGLIPTAAFLEFQAYNVLVIASDIRKLENIEYTPTPDIIHEAAGHAPIIANPEYAEYLRRIGEIGAKAISSHKEKALFQAVRTLASLKERPGVAHEKIEEAQEVVDRVQAQMGAASEMALLKNLHWWTVEYGLIGELENPKIYGAGLLSSIGESTWCMSDQVEKLPYDISAAYQIFDVTRPQPQLYVTPNFAHLSFVLEQFANRMALRKGGLEGVQKLIDSQDLGTLELSTGLQISGVFDRVMDHDRKVSYVHCKGPTALSFRDKELIGHSTAHHPKGFGSPLGKLKGINLAIEDMSPRDLEAYNLYEGRTVELEFEGDITLKGTLVTGTRNLQGKILLITFKDCLIMHKEEALFTPDLGLYNLAVGKDVISAYAGPADYDSFDLIHHVKSESIPIVLSERENHLNEVFTHLREMREQSEKALIIDPSFFETCSQQFPEEWLLWLELYELGLLRKENWAQHCLLQLEELKEKLKDKAHLIQSGIQQVQEEHLVQT